MKQEMEGFWAKGHELISATHGTTIEITKEGHLTKRGNCIVAISSEKGARDLSAPFKRMAQNSRAEIILKLECNGIADTIRAWGDEALTFTHPADIVFRTSHFICARTVAIRSDKSASLLRRPLIMEISKQLPIHISLTARVSS